MVLKIQAFGTHRWGQY